MFPTIKNPFARRLKALVTGNEVSRGYPCSERIESEPPLIVDKTTYQVAEVDNLLDGLDSTRTLIGKEVLYRSMIEQTSDVNSVREKQQAAEELAENENLLTAFDGLINRAAEKESDFYHYIFGKFTGAFGSTNKEKLEFQGTGYDEYLAGIKLLPELVDETRQLPAVKTPYLKQLINTIADFQKSREYQLMKHGPYWSIGGLVTKQEKRLKPSAKFRPGLIKPVLFVMLAIIISAKPLLLNPEIATHTPIWLILFVILGVYIPAARSFDQDTFIYPLAKLLMNSEKVERTLIALGQLDELLAFQRYAQDYSTAMILPEIIQSDHHSLELKRARNPILGKNNPNYVPNDITLIKERLAFVTGANSGGKTALCKTVTQIQLLAQIGCYIPAEQARLSLVDGIYYQTPEVNSLDSDVGRFGTELKYTKSIFINATPASLVILDELAEGTTYEEKLKTSITILNGFLQLGSSTILVTHNHELAEHFKNQGVGIFKQANIEDNILTHHFTDGISKISHAHKVAEKIGFTEDDINAHLSGESKMSDT